ncbi:peptidylprolyl isomerase [bacterium]|nr:peptidylprolyl isomerase [bacterium]
MTTDNEGNSNPIVVMNISNGTKIYVELYPDIAPITVENFLTLVDDGFYTDIVFHRIIAGFMIQAGGYAVEDYEGEDDGGPSKVLVQKIGKKTIKGEFSANGVENNLLHEKGVLSMARANNPNSASTQFFICVEDQPSLDGNYAAFGKVINEESLENAIWISTIPVQGMYIGDIPFEAFPMEPITITSMERYKG